MPLKLMYITNNEQIASVAENCGVDRIFIDMEYIGKEERQFGMDTVKSRHTVEDVSKLRDVIKKSELLVRVNPIHSSAYGHTDSYDEINRVIDAGADILMLPMYRTVDEVEKFLRIVDGRAKTMLLTETIDACNIMDDVLKIFEVDEIHIGLNDLHLEMCKKFMFELLADGTVDAVCQKINRAGKPYGFGGIARIGYGLLPAEYVIAEHYRIGSTGAILSRSFCNADKFSFVEEIRDLFMREVDKIRETEQKVSNFSSIDFEENRVNVKNIVDRIVWKM